MLWIVLFIWIGLWGAVGLVAVAIALAVKRLLNRSPIEGMERALDPTAH